MTTTHAATTDRGDRSSVKAIKDVPSHVRLWLVVGAIVVLDLWSKHHVFSSLDAGELYRVVPHVVEFHRSLNDGAVFGSLTGMTRLFIVASVFAFAFVIALFASSSARQRSLHIALGLILAGALGNLYDRAFAVADVITFESGRKVIGVVLDNSDDDFLRIADWPEGTNVVRHDRASVVKMSRQGVVRDFIKFIPKFPRQVPVVGGRDVWPWVFNVADSALVCGVGVLLINFWLDRKRLSVKRKGSESQKTA